MARTPHPRHHSSCAPAGAAESQRPAQPLPRIHPAIRRVAASLFGVGATLAVSPYSPRASGGVAHIIVNSLGDEATAGEGPNHCTLRKAVANSQLWQGGDTTKGDCAAGAAVNNITFSVSGTITIASTALFSFENTTTTIDGSGQSVTITEAPSLTSPLLYVSQGNLNLKALTLANGHGPRGSSSNFLTSAGALAVNGGTVNIIQSTFANNSGYEGGAISFQGDTLNIANSTFYGNSGGFGGAIYSHAATSVVITNSSITQNKITIGRGATESGAPIPGGAIKGSFTGNFILGNTVLAGNTSNGGLVRGLAANCAAGLTDLGGNLSDDATCGFGDPASFNSDKNPGLDPNGLQSNGGPTQTVALVTGSDAIGKGVASICASVTVNGMDQRGYPRGSSVCDIGAVEYGVGAPNTPAPPTNVTASAGLGSATVSWTGSAASYDVYEIVPGSTPILVESAVTGNSITITGLNPGASYQFEVAALNSNGIGADSQPSAVVHTPPTTSAITVNSLTDGGSSGGSTACTLRKAITNANARGQLASGCPSGGVNSTAISFSASGTITLASKLPTFGNASATTTIDGSGQSVSINGDNKYRLLKVTGGTLNLKALTLASGHVASFVAGSTGGAALYMSGGAVNITQSALVRNGGGFDNFGGAAFVGGGKLSIANSTLYGNYVGSSAQTFPGGAITNDTGSPAAVVITNSTLTANSGNGPGGTVSGASSSGAVYGVATLSNTLLAGNFPSNCGGVITDLGGNLSGDASCKFSATTPALSINSVPIPGLDPKGLQDNGGPTQTVALVAGSQAINAGANSICAASPVGAIDQRGVSRPLLANCTVGAVEYQPPPGNLTGTGTNDGVLLNWIAAGGATTYNVYQVGPGGVLTLVDTVSGTSAALSSLNNGTAYEYVVVAEDGTLPSADSNTVTVTAGNVTPAAFSFTSVTGAAAGATVSSANSVTLSSIQMPAPISIDVGYFCVNSLPCSNVATIVQPNDVVTVRFNAPLVSGTAATANLVIGGVSGSFTVTTQ